MAAMARAKNKLEGGEKLWEGSLRDKACLSYTYARRENNVSSDDTDAITTSSAQ
jgi:hypothetical protein